MNGPSDLPRDPHDDNAALLTSRELLVLQLLGLGYSRQQVASLVWMTAPALAQLEHSACAALGVATTDEAVELARRRGLIL